MGIRLSKEDLSSVWQKLDSKNKGSLEFTDFFVLHEINTCNLSDPYKIKVLKTKIQDNLANERKIERDRIAKEVLSKMAGTEVQVITT